MYAALLRPKMYSFLLFPIQRKSLLLFRNTCAANCCQIVTINGLYHGRRQKKAGNSCPCTLAFAPPVAPGEISMEIKCPLVPIHMARCDLLKSFIEYNANICSFLRLHILKNKRICGFQ